MAHSSLGVDNRETVRKLQRIIQRFDIVSHLFEHHSGGLYSMTIHSVPSGKRLVGKYVDRFLPFLGRRVGIKSDFYQ